MALKVFVVTKEDLAMGTDIIGIFVSEGIARLLQAELKEKNTDWTVSYYVQQAEVEGA